MSSQYYTDDIEQNHERAREDVAALGEFDAWVDGEWAAVADGDTFETRDPVVDEPILSVPRCRADSVDTTVEHAEAAFESEWKSTDATERSNRLLEWATALKENADDLALIESVDGGKPITHAKAEVQYAIEFLEYYAKVAQADEGSTLPTGPDTHVYTRYEPYGVVGLIVPWNFPLIIAMWKVAPALAAGNTVVLKPAEQTPLSALYAASLSKDVLPDGVFNVVTGFGTEAGAPLTEHPTVQKISFTGEDATGEQIMRTASENITPVTLELGGKSPYLVFPDADLEKAIRDISHGIFYNAGQSCDACSRVLVHDDIAEEFTERLADRAESLTPGDTLQEGTKVGPLVSKDQYEKVTEYVEVGKEEGATLVRGGVSDDESLANGWYVEPTIFTDVDNDMRIAQEEIFGPVETIITFDSYEEAIELANDVEFGLAAGVATTDTSIAHRAAADIEAGSIWINGGYATPIPGAPFGGFKRSGIGRELSKDALRHYTQEKAVYLSTDEPDL
ncbi:aldehyde dehydrogenase family protein [Natrinema sp. 74]|uniref:aldehyde dehydrogenase family protein n=1 Tax=Natrinema sp. 74 TaxID=3384159 RepID=UPI0038D38C94